MSFHKTKSKQIIADKTQIRDLVHKTMGDMATIIGSTLGPGGSPVLIERDGLSPLVSKDGVTVAKNIGVTDAAANTIIEAAKEICDIDSNINDIIRIVYIGNHPIPCGGTHIKSTKELKGLRVTKVKTKKTTVKVSYELLN